MKKFYLFSLLIGLVSGLKAQQNRQAAWQQQVDYRIELTLKDVSHYIKAFEQVSYTNNSPHTLTYIYFHLWPNAYKKHSEPFAKQQLENGEVDFYFAPDQDHGMIDSLDFKVDGERVKWELLKDTGDVCKITLNSPLAPGQKIVISTPFRTKFPRVYSRLGHEGQFYAATQWYPKPAVYDVNGWNYMPYLDQGEFYSEFGSFEVKLTVPSNYVVAATGELQEASEKKWLDSLAALKDSRPLPKGNEADENLSIRQRMKLFPPSSETWKTITYRQNNVHDFAWFADKRFNVAKSEVKLPSGRIVETWAYSVTSKPVKATHYIDSAVLFYSVNVGEYPYNICTAVNGPLIAGGGMEYPTITICAGLNERVVLHEVGHNWFYGILGSNERVHPWMDEGINSFYEKEFYAGQKMVSSPRVQKMFDLGDFEKSYESEVAYLFSARLQEDQPIELPSWEYSKTNYAAIVYAKTPVVFRYLRGYLGQALFDSCMHTYYREWQFRHPLPGDLQEVFERISRQKLDWFFKDLISGTDKVDYKICKVSVKEKAELKIKNKGDLRTPFSVSQLRNGKIINTQWIEGFEGSRNIQLAANDSADAFEIDSKREMPELYRSTNYKKRHGFLNKRGPLRIQLAGSLEHPYKRQLFVTPVFGWNTHNKLMLGAAFYNSLLPQKKLEYQLVPLYAPATGDVNGYAGVQRYWHCNSGFIHTTELGYNLTRFRTVDFGELHDQYYLKQNPYLKFVFRKSKPRSSVERSMRFQYISVLEKNQPDKGMNYDFQYYSSRFMRGDYLWQNDKKINPSSIRLRVEHGKDYFDKFIKATVEYKGKFNIGSPRKNLDVRFFAGAMDFMKETGNLSGRYYLQMTSNSYNDYTMDYAVMGRSLTQGTLAQQVLEREGGFKVSTAALSNQWLLAANFKCDIPGVLPIKLYADFGTYGNIKTINPNSDLLIYNAGVLFSMGGGFFEVYFPALSSNDIKTLWSNNPSLYGKYTQKISFNLKLNSLNPFGIIRSIRF